MSIFTIYAKTVKITTEAGEKEILMRPLSGRYLPKLYKVMTAFMDTDDSDVLSDKEKTKQFLEKLDSETLLNIHEMLVETLSKSYPDEKKENIDEFVSKYLFKLFPHLIEVNLSKA